MIRPVEFSVEKSGDYWICNCKQTENRPLCDGTHKKIDHTPTDKDRVILCNLKESPVYDGVAYKLGYKTKHGFQ